MTGRETSTNASEQVVVHCTGCGMPHRFADMAAVSQVWCSGCGQLIEARAGERHTAANFAARTLAAAPLPGSVLHNRSQGRPRPLSVRIALLAGGLAVFMECLAALSAILTMGPVRSAVSLFFSPWWIYFLVWLGLFFNSRRAARIAMAGGVIIAFLVCHYALRQQIAIWGVSPPWPDLVWGTIRVILRSVPLLVMVVCLATRSAREFYGAPFEE